MENNKQETALEFVFNNLWKQTSKTWGLIVGEAKRREKEQIKNAFIEGHKRSNEPLNQDMIDQYYNETYGKK
jgi:hypothetical protein